MAKYEIYAGTLDEVFYTHSLESAFEMFDYLTEKTNKKLNSTYMTIAEMEEEKSSPITIADLLGCDEIFFDIVEDD